MARSISVKVPTATLIADIEAALEQIQNEIAEYPAARAKYVEDNEKYEKVIKQIVIDYIYKNPDKVDIHNIWNEKIGLSISSGLLALPARPQNVEQPNREQSFGREWTTRKALLERNLKVLKMTTQEEVNASTYGAIIELL